MKLSAQERSVGLFSRAAPTYERVGPRHFSYFADKLVEFVGIDAGSDVLDVATGTGAVLRPAGQTTGSRGRVVGIDITPAMLSRAAEVEACSLVNVELREMDGERLDFPESSFDTVLCSFGLQAFSDQPVALVGFHRVLKSGGRVGIVYPLGWPFDFDPRWSWEADVLRSFGALDTPVDDMLLVDLGLAMQAAGFEEIEAIDVTCPLEFRDEDEWWSWSWSHGTRSLFEAVASNRRSALRQALSNGLQSCRGDDGHIHGSMSATITRASKPVAPSQR